MSAADPTDWPSAAPAFQVCCIVVPALRHVWVEYLHDVVCVLHVTTGPCTQSLGWLPCLAIHGCMTAGSFKPPDSCALLDCCQHLSRNCCIFLHPWSVAHSLTVRVTYACWLPLNCLHDCMQALLQYTLDARPKVRKQAQTGLGRACGALHATPAAAPAGDAVLRSEPHAHSLIACLL